MMIVARDAATGDLGCAVQSHWFNVGAIVLWAEPGVGAVATQSFAEPAYGPRGLERMRNGVDAHAALAELTAADAERDAIGRLARAHQLPDDDGLLAKLTAAGDVAISDPAPTAAAGLGT